VASATDESLLVESLGVTVTTIEGDARNIKITRPEDIALAEIILKSLETDRKAESRS
jgi:2-C-methyl-D-erythritol 4-phosphate cytidylyltransferase